MISNNFSGIFLLLFVFYILLKSIFTNTFDAISISYLLLFLFFYYGFVLLVLVIKLSVHLKALLFLTATILLCYIIAAANQYYFKNENFINIFSPNKSIFSILLASQIAFLLPLYLYYRRTSLKFIRILLFFIIILAVFLLFFTNGRAGWIGLMLAIAYISYRYTPRLKKASSYYFVLLFIMSFTLLFLYKSDSSKGRILIYKISAKILKDNWLWGIGHGRFKIKYNEYQATYFSSHNIDSKEAQLAGNSFYAFNDFFQIIIENGLIGFAFFSILIVLIFHQIKNIQINSKNRHLFTAAVASLICISTGSFFSYSLQIFPVTIQAILCLAILSSYPIFQKVKNNLFAKSKRIITIFFFLSSIVFFTHFYYYLDYKSKSHLAFELKRKGCRQNAIKIYEQLSTSYIKDGSVMFSYAQELFCSNQPQQAALVLSNAKKYYCSQEVYKLSASINNELKNFEQAEKDYKTAVYMVPNKMISRKNLLDFYLQRRDTVNAKFWANSIINMPVKVHSTITKSIQQETKEFLVAINNKLPIHTR